MYFKAIYVQIYLLQNTFFRFFCMYHSTSEMNSQLMMVVCLKSGVERKRCR